MKRVIGTCLLLLLIELNLAGFAYLRQAGTPPPRADLREERYITTERGDSFRCRRTLDPITLFAAGDKVLKNSDGSYWVCTQEASGDGPLLGAFTKEQFDAACRVAANSGPGTISRGH